MWTFWLIKRHKTGFYFQFLLKPPLKHGFDQNSFIYGFRFNRAHPLSYCNKHFSFEAKAIQRKPSACLHWKKVFKSLPITANNKVIHFALKFRAENIQSLETKRSFIMRCFGEYLNRKTWCDQGARQWLVNCQSNWRKPLK